MKKRTHIARAKRARRSAARRAQGPASASAAPRAKRMAADAKRAPAGAKRGETATQRAAANDRRDESRSALALPAECTLAGAEGLKLELAELLKSMNGVTIDVSGVRRIDTASLQLLAAFTRDRRASELSVALSGESAAFAEGVRLLGLSRLFA